MSYECWITKLLVYSLSGIICVISYTIAIKKEQTAFRGEPVLVSWEGGCFRMKTFFLSLELCAATICRLINSLVVLRIPSELHG